MRFQHTVRLYLAVAAAFAMAVATIARTYHLAIQDQEIARQIWLSAGDASFEDSRLCGAIPGRLAHVELHRWPENDLSVIANASRVRTLRVIGGHSNPMALVDLSAIGLLSNLEYLEIDETPATKLVLHPQCKLSHLHIQDCPNLVDVHFAGRSLPLDSLSLHNTAITDLGSLGYLGELRFLAISQTPFDFKEIAKLSRLEWLFVTGATSDNIEDISFLSGLTTLHLELNEGVSILPLVRLKRLKTLSVSGYIRREEIDAVKVQLPDCDVQTYEW